MLNEKNETMGAMLVCLAATLWGFDSIVLTPRLFKLMYLMWFLCYTFFLL